MRSEIRVSFQNFYPSVFVQNLSTANHCLFRIFVKESKQVYSQNYLKEIETAQLKSRFSRSFLLTNMCMIPVSLITIPSDELNYKKLIYQLYYLKFATTILCP
ncbi:Hypothetical_protein [Hexamita inflata]|uniref:Hypothetical_protein n=1 Tax=Hexamita inflata TaxID=28002 RepID=A0AA86TX40_9EUKA|nr:Hypothetical protein HINF_LOCUS20295 [Hexamita inflata]